MFTTTVSASGLLSMWTLTIHWTVTDEQALANYLLLFQRLVKVRMQLKPRANALDFSTVQALNKLSAFEHPVQRC